MQRKWKVHRSAIPVILLFLVCSTYITMVQSTPISCKSNLNARCETVCSLGMIVFVKRHSPAVTHSQKHCPLPLLLQDMFEVRSSVDWSQFITRIHQFRFCMLVDGKSCVVVETLNIWSWIDVFFCYCYNLVLYTVGTRQTHAMPVSAAESCYIGLWWVDCVQLISCWCIDFNTFNDNTCFFVLSW